MDVSDTAQMYVTGRRRGVSRNGIAAVCPACKCCRNLLSTMTTMTTSLDPAPFCMFLKASCMPAMFIIYLLNNDGNVEKKRRPNGVVHADVVNRCFFAVTCRKGV